MYSPDARLDAYPRATRTAFTLVELLTVIAIIALLIGILVPSLSAARNQAKNVKTSAILKALSDGCEMFKNENEKEFRYSNGYPPSRGYNPALFSNADFWRRDIHKVMTPPDYDVNGAQWLPRFLMGMDTQGFVRLKDVPTALRNKPESWYDQVPDVGLGYTEPLSRVGPYVKPESVELVKTRVMPTESGEFLNASWDDTDTMPEDNNSTVILDAFGRAILYYAADPLAAANRKALATDDADTDPNRDPGIYNFLDNEGFTGNRNLPGGGGTTNTGADYGAGEHVLATFGNPADPHDPSYQTSFVSYIHNHTVEGNDPDNPIIVPYNPNSFLLITAGRDGIYGNVDDVVNFERQ